MTPFNKTSFNKTPFSKMLVILALGAAIVLGCSVESVFADGAGHSHTASPFLAVEDEAAPKLIAEAPLAGPLARGAVLIPYRVENFRILPIFGAGAVDVSPRAGHVHVTVDGLPWHWADTSDTSTVVVVGLPVGEHKILIELAGPDHRVYTGQTVTFTVPKQAS